MTNQKSADKLISDAGFYFKELQEAHRQKRWNVVVRRAQEVVELSLKAVLKMAGIEYPKVHDIAPLLDKIIDERGIKVEEEEIREIKKISGSLARERGPAFYGERDFSKEDATKAQEGAKKVLKFARNLLGKLGNKRK